MHCTMCIQPVSGSLSVLRYACTACTVAEFKSVVKDTKSNTKDITESISSDYQGVDFG